MLRLHQIKITPDEMSHINDAFLRRLCAKRLGIAEGDIQAFKIVKRSVDARREGVCFVFTIDVDVKQPQREKLLIHAFRPNEAALLEGKTSDAAPSLAKMKLPPYPAEAGRPVVVGAGPAGLFCALALALRGAKPLLLERGKPVEERVSSIELLESKGILDRESNVLFGEGGAGAFSDGKLTCGLSSSLIQIILETLYECGAPQDIVTSAKPHIGTDELRKVLVNLRHKIQALGGEIHFSSRVTCPVIHEGRIAAVRRIENGREEEISCNRLYLAIGHSARDTLQKLFEIGVAMEQKPFAVGVRIEHLQSSINKAQYGFIAGHPSLPPADYKLNIHTPDGRGVYSFCMCPGGRVINASGEENGINVNGMSLHARNGTNANSALLVGIFPQDYGSDHPLAGIAWQRKIEQAAFHRTQSLSAPCQRVGDFLAKHKTTAFGEVLPSYLPGVVADEMEGILPQIVLSNLRYALPLLGRKLQGFDHPDALLTGPETRSSSPVRILRNEQFQSNIHGLYPLGEGAGYAGGIVSAALDGLKAGAEL